MARRDSDSHELRKAATGTLRVAALLLCCACAEPPAPAPAAAVHEAPFPGFGLRGRVDQPTIRWTAPEDLRPAVRQAAALWNSETGQHPRFVEDSQGEQGGGNVVDLEIGWRQGAHDQCMPFGTESSVAHSGPLPLPSFVHLDLDREWDDERRVLTLAHEFGHILGLAHSADSRALMFAEPSGKEPALTDMDRRGLWTLYGSDESPTANDLVVGEQGEPLVLRGVAPVEKSAFGLPMSMATGRTNSSFGVPTTRASALFPSTSSPRRAERRRQRALLPSSRAPSVRSTGSTPRAPRSASRSKTASRPPRCSCSNGPTVGMGLARCAPRVDPVYASQAPSPARRPRRHGR